MTGPDSPVPRPQEGLRAYPVVEADSDPRFCFGLVSDVAAALQVHSYPRPLPGDLTELLVLLFRFLYRSPEDAR